MGVNSAVMAALLQGGDAQAAMQAPVYPKLAAVTDPYLSWREKQANQSRLADLLLPKALPEYLQGMAYGTLPQEPPLTSWRSTATYVPAAIDVATAAPVVRTLGDALVNIGGKAVTESVDAAARAVAQGRRLVPAGQFNMGAGPSDKSVVAMLNQADPATRALVVDELKRRGLRDVQITDGVIRDEIARRNAATMLGLPEGNTAADRATAMGYTTPAYHGSRGDIRAFDDAKLGYSTGWDAPSAYEGHFFTSRPETAGEYAAASKGSLDPRPQAVEDMLDSIKAKQRELEDTVGLTDEWYNLQDEYEKIFNSNPRGTEKIYPVLLNTRDNITHDFGGNEYRDESYFALLKKAKAQGKSGVNMLNTSDNYVGAKENIYAVNDPTLIRSRFAAFDPARARESDILAGLGPVAAAGVPTAVILADLLRMKDRSGM
jgi:hypothetical protein